MKRKPKLQPSPHKEVSQSHLTNEFIFSWRVFSLLLGLTFSYLIYYSHKLSDIESKLQSNIIEINAITVPMPFGPITGHKDYYYINRRDALQKDLALIFVALDKPNLSNDQIGEIGLKLHKTINHIAYSFPFARLLEFKQNGNWVFNPNNQTSIDMSTSINLSFLTRQIDEIYNWNIQLTGKLKDNKQRVTEAIALKPGATKDKVEIGGYLDKLIEYLENHHKLGMILGLKLKEYEYFSNRLSRWKVIILSSLVGICFLCGIALPLFKSSLMSSRIITWIVLVAFIGSLLLLFRAAVYSLLSKLG